MTVLISAMPMLSTTRSTRLTRVPRPSANRPSAIATRISVARLPPSRSAMLATSRPTMTAMITSEPSVGALNCRSRFASVKSSRRARRTAWTTVLAKESIAPAVTAAGGVIPCRWKKRMLTARRAADEGSARFM
jgi:hypothetical protein